MSEKEKCKWAVIKLGGGTKTYHTECGNIFYSSSELSTEDFSPCSFCGKEIDEIKKEVKP